eukprot:g2152.t1
MRSGVLLLASFLLCCARPDFVPTNVWQEVAADQALPAGTQVKVDMDTKKRYAKIATVGASGDRRALTGEIVARPVEGDASVDNDATTGAGGQGEDHRGGGVKVTQLDSSQYAQAHASLGNVPLSMRHKAPPADDNITAEVHVGSQSQLLESGSPSARAAAAQLLAGGIGIGGSSANGTAKNATETMYDVLSSADITSAATRASLIKARREMPKEEFAKLVRTMWDARQKELDDAMKAVRDEAKYMQKLISELLGSGSDSAAASQKADETDAVPDVPEQGLATGNGELAFAEHKRRVLEIIEWEVMDTDKAKDFHTLGGLAAVARELNDTHTVVRAAAAHVIGTFAKNYAEAQAWAIEAGVLPLLLPMLDAPTTTSSSAAQYRKKVKMQPFEESRRAIYAAGSIMRNNPGAQLQFLANGGLDVLRRAGERAAGMSVDGHADPASAPLVVKVLSLATDLLDEAFTAVADSGAGATDEAKLVGTLVSTALVEHAWCMLPLAALRLPNEAPREKALHMMRRTTRGCAMTLASVPVDADTLLKALETVIQEWRRASDEELDPEYKVELIELAQSVRKHFQSALMVDTAKANSGG